MYAFSETAKRNPFLDFLKGILIVLVTTGHTLQFLVHQGQGFWSDPMLKAIYMFHMPLFMGVSGYVSYRGLQGVKETTVNVKGTEVKIAVAHGLKNVKFVMDKVREAVLNNQPVPYHFIEVMACPGGCVGGGGQPYMVNDEIRKQRAKGLYDEDAGLERRCSHENPYVQQLYREFLEKPLSHKAHELLHTTYKSRPLYTK